MGEECVSVCYWFYVCWGEILLDLCSMFKVVSCDFFWDVGKSVEVIMRKQGLFDIKREKEGEYEAFMC